MLKFFSAYLLHVYPPLTKVGEIGFGVDSEGFSKGLLSENLIW